MDDMLTSLAFLAGVLAVGIPLLAACVNIVRLFHGNNLVVHVNGEEFVINVASLEEADIEIIDSATRAVEERAKDRLTA